MDGVDSKELFAANLRRQRVKKRWSQEALGAEAGLHRTEISLLERAGRDVRLSTLKRLSDALGVPVATLVRGIGKKR